MQNSDIPLKFQLAWAEGASSPYITVPIPNTVATPGRASLALGFPPLNFTPRNAGGIPPFGEDFNGILNQITAWNQWQQMGGAVSYDVDFSTAIGGYPKGAALQSTKHIGLIYVSTADDNTTDPDSATAANWTTANRARLVANTNFYVTTSGSDTTGDGSVGSPWATPNKANLVLNTLYDLNGFTATVNVGAGTFTGPTVRGQFVGQKGAGVFSNSIPSVVFLGNGAGSTIFNSTQVSDGAFVLFKNMSMRGTDRALQSFSGAQTCIDTVTFDSTPSSFHMEVYAQGALYALGNFAIAGSVPAWLSVGASGYVEILNRTITFTGTPVWSNAGVFTTGGYAEMSACTCVGSATGVRYSSTYNGVIQLSGTVLAGSSAGTTTTGGQVIP